MEFTKAKDISNLIVSRGFFKRQINLDLNDLAALENLTRVHFQRDEKNIAANLAEIANINKKYTKHATSQN